LLNLIETIPVEGFGYIKILKSLNVCSNNVASSQQY